VLLLVSLVACGSADDDEPDIGAPPPADDGGGDEIVVESTLPPPLGLPAFYGPPDPVPVADPGSLVSSEVVEAPEVHGTVHRVMYVSRSLRDQPIVVSGLVAIPDDPAAAGRGHDVVAWAHGTTGIADVCAPSLDGPESVPLLNELLDAGYVVTATDYEGLGTPGRHPYIVGESEARGVLDSVRAAGRLDGVELSGRTVVWGHSQGGHAAMFALNIAETWAPELDLVGVVAGAPPSQLDLIFDALEASPFRFYLLMAAAGINAAYGDDAAPLGAVLTAEGQQAVNLVDQGCTAELAGATGDLTTDALVAADPATVPGWAELLRANDPGRFASGSSAPLLVIHGGNDEQIPTAASALMFDQLCAVDQDQTRWVYPGQSHAGVIGPSIDDMLTWIGHRFDGEPTPDTMVPTGQPDVAVQSC
jgi:fermentation-respiration switch protein FrsA (DUF1100 family)